jgi:hypothetical protein
VSRGSFYSLSLDPLAKAQLHDAVTFFADALDMTISNSAVIRRAVSMFAAHLAKLREGNPESLALYAESHLMSQAIRGRAITMKKKEQTA